MVGELIAGRYELEKLVGSGGMSNVFRAHDRLLERTVALKILHEQYTRDEDYVERFRREARAVAQLAHPNIVTVIDRGEQEGRQFIVFEYIDGENLKELSNRGPLEVGEAIGLVLQVGTGAVVRARAGPRPPGRQAPERPPQRGRSGQGDRLRHRALPRRPRRHADGHRARDERLHRAGAGPRPEGRSEDGHLLARSRPLRASERRGALLGRQLRRRRDATRERARTERARPSARLSRSARPRDPASDVEGPRGPVRHDGRLRGRARGLPRRDRGPRRRGRDDDRAGAAPTPAAEALARATRSVDAARARRARRGAGGSGRVPAAPRRRRWEPSSQCRSLLEAGNALRRRQLRPDRAPVASTAPRRAKRPTRTLARPGRPRAIGRVVSRRTASASCSRRLAGWRSRS